MTPASPQQALTMPNAPALPPVFASDPLGKKPKPKSSQQTFLGSGSTPPPQQQAGAQKTLLGT